MGVVVLAAAVRGAEPQGRTTSPIMPLAERLGGVVSRGDVIWGGGG